jgi:6-phosphogluconolactonase
MISNLDRPTRNSTAVRWPALFLCLFGVITVGLFLADGCGGVVHSTMPVASTSAFAFVANSGSGNVSALAVNTSGALSPVPGSPFAAGAGAEFMALDSAHNLLFVSNQDAGNLSAFAVNTSTGMLTPVPGSPFATGRTPHGVAIDPAGRFVFVGNQDDNSVSVFSINSTDGVLTPVSGSPFTGIDSPFGVAVNPSGTILFVNNLNSNTVSAFRIDGSSGALSSVPGPASPTGQTPIGLVVDPSGKFLFVGDHMQSTISSFSIDPMSGVLTRISGPAAASAGCNSACHLNPLRLVVHPMNALAVVTNVGANTVSSFTLNNGMLSPMAAPAPTGQHPFGAAFDPSGNFLFVANKVDSSISGFSVNANTGELVPLMGSPFPSGGEAPVGIAVVAKN